MGTMKTNVTLFALLFMSSLLYGQEKPKTSKVLFEPGNISTKYVEYGTTFTRDGSEMYFARSTQQWGKGDMKSTIYHAFFDGEKWSTPKIATFSGTYDDSDPHITPDNKTIYFISKRPSAAHTISSDIWKVKRKSGGGWTEPERMPNPINSEKSEYSPCTDLEGNLYFASDRLGGYGQGDLYMVPNKEEGLKNPINMGDVLNSETGEWNLGVSANGNTLLFEASQRKQNVSGYGDLYISFKRNDSWTIPQNIVELNTSGSDLCPFLTQHTEQLYFTSSDSLKSGDTNIYVADFSSIQKKYQEQAQFPTQYLLVVNRSEHNISLFNLKNKKLQKTIGTGLGPHEIALSKNNHYAYVANYGSYPKPHEQAITNKQLKWIDTLQNSITKINLKDFTTQTITIPDNPSPHGVLTNIDGSLVWITDENKGIVREIDGNKGIVLRKYATMIGSHILKSTSDFSKLFVSNIESNTISVIDRNEQKVEHISTPAGPEGMEVSPDGQFLWVLCNGANKIMVIDTKNLQTVKIIDSKGKFPVKMIFVNREAWVVNVFSKNIAIFDTETLTFKENLTLESSPLGISGNQNYIFITLPRKNLIQAYEPKSRKVIFKLSEGMEQDGMFLLNDIGQLISD